MNRILLFVMFLVSYNSTKFCAKCKHFKPSTTLFFNVEFGKCSLYPQDHIDTRYFVTGDEKYITKDFYFCNTARNVKSMCGKDGKYYEEK
jgi:hypothetical protein